MSKGFFSSANTYFRNMIAHLRLVTARQEGLRNAWAAIVRDARKVKHTLVRSEAGDRHRKAVKLVKAGREKYNAKHYTAAERLFRRAIEQDPQYMLPVAYLGHALYKLGAVEEAIGAWKRAYAADPSSEGGIKALEKLHAIQRQKTEVVESLEQQIKR
jgi:tetratricopeptide (TPR) repeat protein